MTEDAQINSELAIKVMGWELLEIGYVGTESETPRQKELEDWIDEHRIESVGEYWIDADENFWIWKKHWKPVLYIHQAWLVLEKFRERAYHIRISTSADGDWCCEIESLENTVHVYEAADISKAICVCALRTLEKD